jgi:DNA-3-methyladenine glycosylase
MTGQNSFQKLPRDFYTRCDPLVVARELLGKLLIVPAEDGTRVSGFIVETEAYMGPDDKASHAFGLRRTQRNEAMYQIGGTVYVFFVYGMYFQFNVVTNVEETPHAILVRAVEPFEGIEIMRERRKTKNDKNLTNGPGKLCIALGIDRRLDKEDLLGERVWLENSDFKTPKSKIASGKRIGIDYAEEYAEKAWRFWVKDNSFVSRK